MTTSPITAVVVNHYSAIARDRGEQDISFANKVAQAFGYSLADLTTIPDGANMGLSCGNPLAMASLKPGEIVIDLGCGAGFDVFQASRAVGVKGQAIGVDMSSDMLQRAQKNAEKDSLANIKFFLAPITATQLKSSSADCVISNCVINLLPTGDKVECFREIYRLLKPGGRLAITDILAKKPISDELREDISLYVGCISGASLANNYEKWLKEAGFQDILLVDKKVDLNMYKDSSQSRQDSACCAMTNSSSATSYVNPSASTSDCMPSFSSIAASSKMQDTNQSNASSSARDIDFNEWASSYGIYAIKSKGA